MRGGILYLFSWIQVSKEFKRMCKSNMRATACLPYPSPLAFSSGLDRPLLALNEVFSVTTVVSSSIQTICADTMLPLHDRTEQGEGGGKVM